MSQLGRALLTSRIINSNKNILIYKLRIYIQIYTRIIEETNSFGAWEISERVASAKIEIFRNVTRTIEQRKAFGTKPRLFRYPTTYGFPLKFPQIINSRISAETCRQTDNFPNSEQAMFFRRISPDSPGKASRYENAVRNC